MATLISVPDSLSLSRNLKKVEIASSQKAQFKLSSSAAVIIDESYYPNAAGRIVIDITDVINNYLSVAIPNTDVFQQASSYKAFTIEVDDLNPIQFVALKAGVENLSDTAVNFLTANWLTWQPQVKKVSYSQPEWLSYYATNNCIVKVKFYLKNNTSAILAINSQSAATCYTYNMQFAHIMTLHAGEKYGYYDVWVEDAGGARLTYVQRYIYTEKSFSDEYFLFENSLGGIDTAVMSGESTFSPKIEHQEGSYQDEIIQIDSSITRNYEKNTGWKSKHEAEWLFDFFRAKNRFLLVAGDLKKIVIKESTIADSTMDDLKNYSFVYSFSSDLGLLNIARSMEAPPADLEISTPDSLFFLAPRLVDFPAAELDDNLLFPVQSPFLTIWKKLSWGNIWNFIYEKLLLSAVGLMAHVHDNFLVIAELSEVNGKLKYKGEDIAPAGGLGVTLGETAQTAYRGDRGKIAYDHTLNSAPHFSSPAQKLKLTDIANEYHTLADPAVDGLLIQTLIPTSVASDYINIEISGFGKIDAGPFAWSGQIYYTSGNFASAAIKSVGRGETLDVRIFIRDGLIGLWVNGKVKSILNFFNVKLSVCYGDELTNLIDTITDAPYPASGLTAEIAFKDYPETFLRGIPAADQLRIDRAVIATDATQYKFWVGTAPDYAAISQKEPNTFYYIT